MRGKGGDFGARWSATGITPAHAGKRVIPRINLGTSWDHPRPCGEKALFKLITVTVTGSPPPMRGKDFRIHAHTSFCRITPAHAGKSHTLLLPLSAIQDHPRPCGEKCTARRAYQWAQGSPPPMRGKVGRLIFLAHADRITPAHAGKSNPHRTGAG